MKWKEYLTLLRPLNCFMTSIGILIGGIVAGGLNIFSLEKLFLVLLAMSVGFLATGGGNSLNDYVDFEIDKVNHPERPLPSGRLKRDSARVYSLFLFISAFFISFLISSFCVLLAALNISLMILYELSLKKKGFSGNLTISWLTGSVFLFGGAALYQDSLLNILGSSEILATLVLSLLAFLSSAGREIIKDMEDIEGDKDRDTLPKKIGKKKSSFLAGGFILTAVLLSPLPYMPFALFSWLYLVLVIPADILFFISVSTILKNPTFSQKMAKLAMLTALFSFFVGGIA